MRPFSLFQKIFFSIIGMLAGTSLLVFLLYYLFSESAFLTLGARKWGQRILQRYVPSMVEIYENQGGEAYLKKVQDLAERKGFLIHILDENSRILPGIGINELARIAAAPLQEGRNASPLFLSYQTPRSRYLASLVFVDNRLALRPYEWIRILFFFGVFLATSCGCSWLLARHFVQPLERLARNAQILAKGELDLDRIDSEPRRSDEIGHLERSFFSMALHLQQATENQEQLIADISHDFRSPLTRIQVAADLLMRKAPQEQGLIERIGTEVRNLEGMISAVLELARKDCLYREIQPELIDLEPMLQELADNARFEASWKAQSLLWHSSGPCYVRGVPLCLRSAVENVLRNALRYTPEKGEIRLALEICDPGLCRIIVEDSGPGVGKDELEAIFRPFYRGDAARNQNGGGTGLGLAIVQKTILLNGGSVWAENRDCGGLRVVMELPLAKES